MTKQPPVAPPWVMGGGRDLTSIDARNVFIFFIVWAVLIMGAALIWGYSTTPEPEPAQWPTIIHGADEGCIPNYPGNQAC